MTRETRAMSSVGQAEGKPESSHHRWTDSVARAQLA